MLRELGAYDEALRTYEALLKRWPNEVHWGRIRIGATHRTLGRLNEALGEIDILARETPEALGMAYHYHRGWTLSLMGRDQEAAAEFSAGLETQPDYAWALVRRACSLGRLGRLRQAVADQKRAAALIGKLRPRENELKGMSHNRAWATAALRQLERDLAVKAAKSDAACSGYWEGGDSRRERSPLLPPA
jgi:tetratricopeptide (TPR) repeat protein